MHILLKMIKKPEKNKIYSLILAPTRELGSQIYEIANVLVKNTKFTCGLFIGNLNSSYN